MGDSFYQNVMAEPVNLTDQTDYQVDLKKGFIKITSNPLTGDPILVDDPVAADNADFDSVNLSLSKDASIFNMTDDYVTSMIKRSQKIMMLPQEKYRVNADMAAAFHNMAVAAFTKIYVHANRLFAISVKNSLSRLADYIPFNDVIVYPNSVNFYCGTEGSDNGETPNLTVNIPNVFDLSLLLNYHDGGFQRPPMIDQKMFSTQCMARSTYDGPPTDINEYQKSPYNCGVLCNLTSYLDCDIATMLGPILAVMGTNFNLFNNMVAELATRAVPYNISKDVAEKIADYLLASYNACQSDLIVALENTVYVLWCEAERYGVFKRNGIDDDDDDWY